MTFLTALVICFLTRTRACISRRTSFAIQKVTDPCFVIISPRWTCNRGYGRLVLRSVRAIVTNRTLNTFCAIFKSKTGAIRSNRTCITPWGSCSFRAIITGGANLTHFRTTRTVQSFWARFAGFNSCLIGKARVCSGWTRKLGIIFRTKRAIVTSRTRVVQVGV